MSQISSVSSSSSQESLGLPPPPRYPARRVLRAVETVDELDALGFAGVPRRYASIASSSTSSLSCHTPQSPDGPPPAYESAVHHLGFGGVTWSYDEPEVSDDVVMISHGDVIKAKLRYKLHKLRMGKNAEEWHIFLNKSLKPGEASWAPLGSALWKVPRSQSLPLPPSESPSPTGTERRSSI